MMLKCGQHPVCLDGVHPSCEFIHHQDDNTEEEEDDKFSKRWYLVVIALLYIGKSSTSCCVLLQLVLSGRSDNLLLSEHHTSGEEASSSPRPDAQCCWDKLWEWYYHPTFVVITISWQTRIWSWFHTMECARCWRRVPQVTTTGEAR